MVKRFTLALGCFIASIAYANQIPSTVYFLENEKIELALSPGAYNKVFVANEKITDFHFVIGDFMIADTNDLNEFIPQDDGSIYLVPLSDKKPIIYLSTNKRHHVALEVSLTEGSGQVIGLKYGQKYKPNFKQSAIQKSPPEVALKALVEGKVPPGFISISEDKSNSYQLAKPIHLKLIKAYSNKKLNALIYQAQNTSNSPVSLTPQMFVKKGTQAVTMSQELLNPHQAIYVYTIMEVHHA